MDCNMDEAIRTKEMAESKLQKNDFAGARMLALKTQKLYPNLDNINQLLSVCDVHCASQQKIHGYEMDWYGILQIGQTADDSLIKKHYRKLALLLHPDKNKLPGAEAAFKLIGEAQRLLSDPLKRQSHDMKRRVYVRPSTVHVQSQQTKNKYSGGQCADAQNSHFGQQYANVKLRQQHQPPVQTAFATLGTYVTACPHCTTISQVRVLDRYRSVLCHSCKMSYIASEVHPEKLSKEKNDRSAPFVEKDILNQGQSGNTVKFEGNTHSKNLDKHGSNEPDQSKGDVRKNEDTKPKKYDSKRKKQKLEEVTEDIDTDSDFDNNEYEAHVANGKLGKHYTAGSDDNLNFRRSTRQKQKISYNECESDDDELLSHSNGTGSMPEREKQGAKVRNAENVPLTDLKDLKMSCENFKPTAENDVEPFACSKEKFGADGTQETRSDSQYEDSKSPKNESLGLPESEFFNFENDRPEFEVGQMWAIYSDDEMPKYYAEIQRILHSPEFKLVIRWLNPCREKGNMSQWSDRKMPFGCGIFKLSKAKQEEYQPDTFSHILDPQTCQKGEFAIFPKKGEVWALYKGWNLKMKFLDLERFEYEVAEVVDVGDQTVEVLPLHLVSGHVSVFKGWEDGITISIPRKELLQFSHRIPSFRLTNELNGTLKGYWELDPAAVPPTLLCSS